MEKFTINACLLVIVLVSTQSVNKGYKVGDAATDFALKNTDGKTVSLSDYKNTKGFIIIFDCNTCPVSKLYNSRIIALNKKYSPLGFPVIAINSNDEEKSPGDSYEDMVKEAKEKRYDFPYLYDQSQQVAQTYGATNTPHVFVLRKTGADLKVEYIGAIDNNARDGSMADKKYVENAVDALLNGNQIQVSKTKAIGCGIKWKGV